MPEEVGINQEQRGHKGLICQLRERGKDLGGSVQGEGKERELGFD